MSFAKIQSKVRVSLEREGGIEVISGVVLAETTTHFRVGWCEGEERKNTEGEYFAKASKRCNSRLLPI